MEHLDVEYAQKFWKFEEMEKIKGRLSKEQKPYKSIYKKPLIILDYYMSELLTFEWNKNKDIENQKKHNVSFTLAQEAFYDLNRIIMVDQAHSIEEERMFCIGKVKNKIMTVRFTIRGTSIRIIGAGFWRKGKKYYEEENK